MSTPALCPTRAHSALWLARHRCSIMLMLSPEPGLPKSIFLNSALYRSAPPLYSGIREALHKNVSVR